MLLDRVVIGSDFESILYAFLSDSYFIPTLEFGPMFYETLSSRVLSTDRRDISWARFQVFLALTGKLLNYKDITLIKVEDESIKLISSEGVFKYNFSLCEIFDSTNVQIDNSVLQHRPDSFFVYDDFELSNLGGKHDYLPPRQSSDKLSSEIHYYISTRVDGADYVTDCVCKSTLTREQLNDVEYSDSMVRFAVEHHLEEIGVHGNFMKLYKNGKPKFRKPKVVHKKRIVVRKENTTFQDTENVKFRSMSLQDILDEYGT